MGFGEFRLPSGGSKRLIVWSIRAFFWSRCAQIFIWVIGGAWGTFAAEDTEAWHQEQAEFFQRPRRRTAKTKGEAKAKAKTRPKRKGKGGATVEKARRASAANLHVLDNAVRQTRKRGLEAFMPQDEQKELAPSKRHCLVLHYDEASLNLAMGQWLLYKQGMRCLLVRDVYHKEWKDCAMALKDLGLYHVILLTTLCHNLPYGPWDGQM